MKKRVFLLLAPALVCAQPPQPSPAAGPPFPPSTLNADSLRVASVGYRIALRARPYCPEPLPQTGMGLFHLAQYRGAARQDYIARYALDRGPGVLLTVADSPAARAGLRAGDVLLGVDGAPLPNPDSATPRRGDKTPAQMSDALIERALAKGPTKLHVLRDGAERDLVLAPVSGCPLRIRLVTSNTLGASSRDGIVRISTRMLEFVQNDDELAVVIGHELAHVVLHHAERLEDASNGKASAIGSKTSRVRAAEVEADRLGLRLAWAAGYDPSVALAFWPRLDAAHGGWWKIPTDHPGAHERVRLTEATIAELAREKRPQTQGE